MSVEQFTKTHPIEETLQSAFHYFLEGEMRDCVIVFTDKDGQPFHIGLDEVKSLGDMSIALQLTNQELLETVLGEED